MISCRPWLLPLLLLQVLEFFVTCVRFGYSQSDSQNLEAFYPFPILAPSPAPSPSNSNDSYPVFPPPGRLPPLIPGQRSSSNDDVVKAVVATAVSTFVIASLLFFFVRKRLKRKITHDKSDGGLKPGIAGNDQAEQVDGNSDEMIIDENGLDVVYWRKLDGQNKSSSFRKIKTQDPEEDHDDKDEDFDHDQIGHAIHGRRKSNPIQEVPLLRGKSSSSEIKVVPEIISPQSTTGAIEKQNVTSGTPNPPPPPPPRPPIMAIPAKQGAAKKNTSAPLPPTHLTSRKKCDGTPSPPPPPPPKAAGAAKGIVAGGTGGGSSTGEDKTGSGNGQVKLKPLHWDKVNKHTDHSMVWDKIDGGSFKVDDDLMEALFGYVATNRRSPKKQGETSDSKLQIGSSTAQITILDPRKSQNIAIVLKSLGISGSEVLDALADGRGLNAETLEGLMRIAPTKEEESLILGFEGDTTGLADAESFLYHILKPFPSAFPRINAMLFRLNYDSEILQYKESLHALELGCKELRNRGLFMKLLEAILKAGNRMNAGTSRGNAQAFDLTSLQKLSDVKSTDGSTTLLHFIVEEVIRLEGKRCFINRNRSLNRSLNRSGSSTRSDDNSPSKGEREKEYMTLGLPMVGGLSEELSNVNKAAKIDYNSFAGTCSSLTARISEVRHIASQCAANGGGGFAGEMKGFLETAEEEVKILKEEEKRVMELVKRTTEYYQPGGSKLKGAQPLQLFVIIKDFLGMVDVVCIEIARKLQKRRTPSSDSGSSPKSPPPRTPVKFRNLPEHFMKEKSSSSSSESETEF